MTSLLDWRNGGWIRPHTSTPDEIRDLFRIVDRDLTDAASASISADARHVIAYNGALKLCAVLLFAEGYRPEKGHGSHQRAIDSLPLILGTKRQDDADYLNTCRAKRNASAYEYVGAVSASNAEELITFTRKMRVDVLSWLEKHHPELAVKVPK